MITTTDCVYLQFMSTCTVESSGCVLLLLEAWHFSWECRSWRPRFLTVISLRTRWPPTLVLRTVETLLATCSFRYHVTTGWGFPMTKETKKINTIFVILTAKLLSIQAFLGVTLCRWVREAPYPPTQRHIPGT